MVKVSESGQLFSRHAGQVHPAYRQSWVADDASLNFELEKLFPLQPRVDRSSHNLLLSAYTKAN